MSNGGSVAGSPGYANPGQEHRFTLTFFSFIFNPNSIGVKYSLIVFGGGGLVILPCLGFGQKIFFFKF